MVPIASDPRETDTDDNVASVTHVSAPRDLTGPEVTLGLSEDAIVPTGTTVLTLSFTEPIALPLEAHISLVETTGGIRPPEHVYLDADCSSAALIFEGGLANGQYTVRVRNSMMDTAGNALDGDGDGSPGGDFIRQFEVRPAIVGRHVFYSDSAFDGNDLPTSTEDNAAIAPNKQGLLPRGSATFASYTSYDKGINGIMVDVAGLPGTPTMDDFVFKTGNNEDPGRWSPVPAPPEITVREDAGIDNSDRITLTWPDNAIQNTWLQVTVLATVNTGLAEPNVFYFGNAIGETGNSTTDTRVNAIDALLARNNSRTLTNPAPIDFPYDFNRDARVNATDMLIARNNQTHSLTALKLITIPESKGITSAALRLDTDEGEMPPPSYDAILDTTTAQESEALSAKLDRLFEFERTQQQPEKTDQTREAVDQLLQIWA